MSILIILAIAAITAIGGMIEIFIPVYERMKLAYPDDMVVTNSKIAAVTTYLVMVILFPLVLLALLIPSYKETITESFYSGLSGEAQ